MIGTFVRHAHFGRGQVVAAYRNGAEWLVRFDSGLRFRRPAHEFSVEGEAISPDASGAAPPPFGPAIALSPASSAALRQPSASSPPLPNPMPPRQLEARRLVEALRVGVAPLAHVRELTIGLEAERESLAAGLNRALDAGGDVRAVIGEYGFGKSHYVQLAAEEALARRFLVATAGLDIVELPAHRPFDIYAALMRSLRYPDSDERGLTALLEATANPRIIGRLHDIAPLHDDPLSVSLAVLAEATGSRARRVWAEWLMGAKKAKGMAKLRPKGVKMPTLYTAGHNERQLAYLLTAVSALARLAGYSGLAVLVDEAESYSLLNADRRAKAGTFFSAVVYAALGDGATRVDPASLPQHRFHDYPARFGDGQSLFFLFTLTHSDHQMPLDAWLDPPKILTLDPHPSPQEIGQFLQHLQAQHAQAFAYSPGERQNQVRRAAGELLADGARRDLLSIRGVVRLAVELYDLLFLYPDYEVPILVDDLRRQLR